MRKIISTIFLTLLFGFCLYSQIPTEGLVLYFPFNYDVKDHSGNGNNGDPFNIFYLRGDRGITGYFAPDTYVEIKDTASLDFSAVTGLTISTWMRQEQDIGGYIVVKMGTGGLTEYEFKLAVSEDGTINSGIYNPPSILLLDSNGKLFLNEWYHIVLRWDPANSTVSLFFNGELNSVAYTTIKSIQNTSIPLRIGQYVDKYANSFRGSMDELRIYNRPLSDVEIMALYTTKVVTGLDETPGPGQIEVYPNPVQSEFNVELPEFSGQADYSLNDVSGKLILKGKLNPGKNAVDASELRPGVYSIQINEGNQTVTRKIVKE